MIKYCPECGKKRIENTKFCVYCGVKFQEKTNQTVNNNFEVNRTPVKSQNEILNNNPHISYNCPICNSQLESSENKGLISKNTSLTCRKCILGFNKDNENLTLNFAQDNTRAKSKLLNQTYSIEQWHNIFHKDFSFKELNEIKDYNNPVSSNHSCPLCGSNLNTYEKKGLLSKSRIMMCPECKLTLSEKNNKYKLITILNNFSPLWKYQNEYLTRNEIKRISKGGLSDKQLEIKNKELLKQTESQDIAAFRNSLSTENPMLPAIDNLTIILKKGETAILRLNNITLSEPRAVRTTVGGYSGTSVRITKGVTLHTGGTRGRSVSHDEIKNIDNGDLIITNKRMIFLGSNRTTNIDLNKIVSLEDSSSQIKVQRSNKQKPEYFSGINHNRINVTINGRSRQIKFDGSMIKDLIIGLL